MLFFFRIGFKVSLISFNNFAILNPEILHIVLSEKHKKFKRLKI